MFNPHCILLSIRQGLRIVGQDSSFGDEVEFVDIWGSLHGVVTDLGFWK